MVRKAAEESAEAEPSDRQAAMEVVRRAAANEIAGLDSAAEIARMREEIFLLTTLMDNVPDVIYFKDRDSRFTRINRYAAEHFGVADPALAVGRTDFEFFTKEHAAPAFRDEQEIIRTGQPLVNLEEKETLPNGAVRWVSTTKLPLRDVNGSIVGTFGISRDISQRKQAEEELERRAFYDPLTELPNRALFMNRLRHLFHRARRAQGRLLFAVLYFDLDRFKGVNDSLGHQAGDELLVGIARRFVLCLRPSDTLARLGGDEFTILLEDISCESDATRVAERIQAALKEPFVVSGHELFSSVSLGIALSRVDYECPEDMLRDADTAMYRAKARGRATHQVFQGDMHKGAVKTLRLETDLRLAVERGEIVPHYQPIVELETRTVLGFEALARWRHPTRGMISPEVFIPIAEETGLIGAIGEQMLAEACRQARLWQPRSGSTPPLGISVNVSTRQLAQAGLPEQVERILGETGLDPTSLTLEITESALVHNLKAGAGVVERLRDMSVRLHLDDFGTGYSSLSYLNSFPVDALKIDRSFVSRMDGTPRHEAMVKSIVSLAHNLEMEVVAEGVETELQAEALRALRCRSAQGFLFSRPLPAEEADRLIRDRLLPERA
jgi:diguanylate cyclase (GGDEF)-like protein/PAS domain S-box-containing protein